MDEEYLYKLFCNFNQNLKKIKTKKKNKRCLQALIIYVKKTYQKPYSLSYVLEFLPGWSSQL